MMMARDSTPNRSQLSSAAIESLRSALQEYLERTDDTPSERLQPALRTIATEAREKKIQAEQLLVLLKDVWFALPAVANAMQGDRQTRLLQRVVTLCIREYYAS